MHQGLYILKDIFCFIFKWLLPKWWWPGCTLLWMKLPNLAFNRKVNPRLRRITSTRTCYYSKTNSSLLLYSCMSIRTKPMKRQHKKIIDLLSPIKRKKFPVISNCALEACIMCTTPSLYFISKPNEFYILIWTIINHQGLSPTKPTFTFNCILLPSIDFKR